MWALDHKEGWVPKKWCFQNAVLEITLESPLDGKETKSVNPKGNQPSIFIRRTDGEALILGHLIWRADSLEKTPMLGKIEGKRRRGQQRMRWLGSITNSKDMNLSKPWGTVEDRRAWHAAVHEVAKSWPWLKWLRWGNSGNSVRLYFSGLQNHCRWWLQPWN